MFTLKISPYVTGSSVLLPIINEVVSGQVNLFDRVYTDRYNFSEIVDAVHQGLLERLIKLDSVSHPLLPSNAFVPPPKPLLEAKWTGALTNPGYITTSQTPPPDDFDKVTVKGNTLSWRALKDLGARTIELHVNGTHTTSLSQARFAIHKRPAGTNDSVFLGLVSGKFPYTLTVPEVINENDAYIAYVTNLYSNHAVTVTDVDFKIT